MVIRERTEVMGTEKLEPQESETKIVSWRKTERKRSGRERD